MTEIPLTQGFVAIVDDADAAVLAHKWCAFVTPSTVYAVKAVRLTDGRYSTTRLHNFLTGWRFVDHINGNGLDNRRSNLRPATASMNGANQKTRKNNTSGFKGVSRQKRDGRWVARIRVGGRRLSLGVYSTPELAARAYDAAAREHFGEFARPNFPEDS